ncbi:MAG: DNA-3-methyladenine glycosylase [Saprospiraceae bacterium]|jgi:DNA-3-methyladenine glycosylase
MMERRKVKKSSVQLTNGPWKWTSAMGITTSSNGIIYWEENSPIRIYQGDNINHSYIIAGPRVGIKYAQAWAHMPWRYRIKDNIYTSKPENVNYD